MSQATWWTTDVVGVTLILDGHCSLDCARGKDPLFSMTRICRRLLDLRPVIRESQVTASSQRRIQLLAGSPTTPTFLLWQYE